MRALDINDENVIVGSMKDKNKTKAFVFFNGVENYIWDKEKNSYLTINGQMVPNDWTPTSLNSLIMCSDIDNFSSANAINNKNQIVGDAEFQGKQIGFMIYPKKKI